MVSVHNDPALSTSPQVRAERSPLRHFGWCFSRTWLLSACGGAVCAALSINVISLAFFFLTMPFGFLLVATYGLPIILPIAWWLSRQRPGPDPIRFVRTLQILGTSIALLINGTTNIYFVANEVSPFPSGSPISPWKVLGSTVLAIVFVAASGFVGWTCGAILAHRYLVEIDHPAVPARHVARRRRPWR